jgi:hypothetical protein
VEPINFLTLDVEGAEYDALCGALDALRSSVLAVRAEVVFTPVYKVRRRSATYTNR